MHAFLTSLKERKIAQWSVSYLAAAWIALQVLGQLAGTFAWDPRVMRIITSLIGVGFLAVLVLAYYHGERGRQRVNATESVLLLLLVIAAGSIAYVQSRHASPSSTVGPDIVAPPKSIAVLPFTSITHDAESDALAAGVQDEVLTALAKIGDLKVISRTSVQQYAGTTKTIPVIGHELGVRTILVGSVQRSGTAVQVQAQLVDATSQDHVVWAEKFPGELSNVFAIQSDIAEKVTSSLKSKLTDVEREQLTTPPTKVPAAYEAYKAARQIEQRPGFLTANFQAAAAMYQRAIDLDPGFALAYARMSMAQGGIHWYHSTNPEARAWQRASAEKAIALAPDLPEAHEALGLAAYWLDHDYAKASSEFTIAARGLPGDAALIGLTGYALRRQGKWDQAVSLIEQSVQLDPNNSSAWGQVGAAYLSLHRYDDAIRATRHALDIAPDNMNAAGFLDIAAMRKTGKLDEMRRVVNDPILSQSIDETLPYHRFLLAYYSRDVEGGLRLVHDRGRPFLQQVHFIPVSLASAWLHVLQKNPVAARSAFDSARVTADSATRAQPKSPPAHMALAFAWAGLGNAEAATREARTAMALMPSSRDALNGVDYEYIAAQVFAQVGRVNEALSLLEKIYLAPNGPAAADLRLDPRWDPIREQPRFKALLARGVN